jgi:GntR family transcriptional regulator
VNSEPIGVERRLPFTLVENCVLEDEELDRHDVLVYLALAKYAGKDRTCWPSIETIAKVARVSRSKAFECIRRLEARGYLRRAPRFTPGGQVTSNVYQLLETKVERYAVHALDGHRPPGGLPAVHAVDSNKIQREPEKEREAPPRAECPLPASSQPMSSLSSLLSALKHEARAHGCPLVVGKDWTDGLASLAETVSETEILAAFVACMATAPERVSFFPRDFLRWRKKARKANPVEILPQGKSRGEDLAQIRALQDSEEGRAMVAAAVASVPWRRKVTA